MGSKVSRPVTRELPIGSRTHARDGPPRHSLLRSLLNKLLRVIRCRLTAGAATGTASERVIVLRRTRKESVAKSFISQSFYYEIRWGLCAEKLKIRQTSGGSKKNSAVWLVGSRTCFISFNLLDKNCWKLHNSSVKQQGHGPLYFQKVLKETFASYIVTGFIWSNNIPVLGLGATSCLNFCRVSHFWRTAINWQFAVVSLSFLIIFQVKLCLLKSYKVPVWSLAWFIAHTKAVSNMLWSMSQKNNKD